MGYQLHEEAPNHLSLSRIRTRLRLEFFHDVHVCVLQLLIAHKLIDGATVGVDASLLEAKAAMKTIVRKDNGEDGEEYVRRLAALDVGALCDVGLGLLRCEDVNSRTGTEVRIDRQPTARQFLPPDPQRCPRRLNVATNECIAYGTIFNGLLGTEYPSFAYCLFKIVTDGNRSQE